MMYSTDVQGPNGVQKERAIQLIKSRRPWPQIHWRGDCHLNILCRVIELPCQINKRKHFIAKWESGKNTYTGARKHYKDWIFCFKNATIAPWLRRTPLTDQHLLDTFPESQVQNTGR